MKKSTIPHWIAIATLSIALIFIINIAFLGKTEKMEDGRIAIRLENHEREMVLGEMRKLLETSQKILENLAKDDIKSIEQIASKVGSKAISTVDMKLAPKLPSDFRALGFGLHKDFDSLSEMSKDGKSHKEIELKLSNTMNKCIACHQAYQLPVKVN